MPNPLHQLKYLPWLSLMQVAGLAVLLATVLDVLLIASLRFKTMQDSLTILFSPPLDLVMLVVISMGVGALAVYLLAHFFKRVAVTTGVLWALIFCLMVVISIKSLLPIPELLIGSQQGSLMGLLLGVFLGGWQFWR